MGYKKKNMPKNLDYIHPTQMAKKNVDNCIDDKCPDDCDLLLLRDAAADERDAIAFYLRAGHETCMSNLFLGVAEDEMHHYAELMQMVNVLDPIQAEMFAEAGVSLTLPRRPKAKYHPPVFEKEEEDDDDLEQGLTPPDPNNLERIDLLTKAIRLELMAINKYQRYMMQACHPEVKALFCHIMNEEKEHVAEFTKALFCLTHEPLSSEHD